MTPSILSRSIPRSRAHHPQATRRESGVLRGALRPPTLGRAGSGLAAVLLGGLALACGGLTSDDEALLTASENLSQGPAQSGARLFDRAFPHTNGRSCATCHVHEDHTTLSPDHVAQLLASDPDDPLFNALDADDPGAAPRESRCLSTRGQVAPPDRWFPRLHRPTGTTGRQCGPESGWCRSHPGAHHSCRDSRASLSLSPQNPGEADSGRAWGLRLEAVRRLRASYRGP